MKRIHHALFLLAAGSWAAADDQLTPPSVDYPTVVDARWVRSDGKISMTMTQIRPETRTTLTTISRVVDGRVIVEQVPREYTVSVPVMVTVQAETTRVLDGAGKAVDAKSFPERLAKAKVVLLTTKAIDPVFQRLLRDDGLVLVAPTGLSSQGADSSRLPRMAQAKLIERDGDLKLSLAAMESTVSKKQEKEVLNGRDILREIEVLEAKPKTRELIYDGVATQAYSVKGEAFGTRALLKRLKQWTPVLVSPTKPDAALLATFRDDAIVLIVSDGPKAAATTPSVPPPSVPPRRVIDRIKTPIKE